MPNTLPYYGETIVELYCVLSVANFHYEPQAGTFKQCWLTSYGSILHTITASCENCQDNHTMVRMPGQFCNTIGAILSMCNTVLKQHYSKII